jgi:glycosyltransferase involved in cell wall biosynthesis
MNDVRLGPTDVPQPVGRAIPLQRPLTVLVNAGPWLPVPPPGYGGIENVVASLVDGLRDAGHRVVLASVGESRIEVDELVPTFPTGQFGRLAGPYADVVGIAHPHMSAVLAALDARPDIDIVHDHLEVVGPSMLVARGAACPPTLQTLHWDLHKHPRFYEEFDGRGRVAFAAVSASQLERAPANLARQVVGTVPLAAPVDPRPPEPAGDHVLALGRIAHIKGPHIAARACRRAGQPLVLAGPVAGLENPSALAAALAEGGPVAASADVRYFLDEVEPLLDGRLVRWVGAVGGAEKNRLLRTARALVCPLQWEEPGGTAMVEALLAGVPVIGFRRGVLPSLVTHGVTGFVVDTEDELADCLRRADGLDRAAIAEAVREQMAPTRMVDAYVRLYHEVIRKARPSTLSAGPAAAR